MKLSTPEQRLLAFAREQFGDSLTQFLAAGLGEDEASQSWLFTIEFTEHSTKLRREVNVNASEHSDGSTRLPRRREPLVILALLKLLILRDQKSSASLSYDLEEILQALGWKDTIQARRMIDEAAEQYSNLTYQWAMGADEMALKGHSFYKSRECFVSGFSRINVEGEGGEYSTRVVNCIYFNADFIERLRERSLFGINWNAVQSVTHNPVIDT